MRAAWLALLLLLGGACTAANPDYDPDAAAALCQSGQRRCSAAGQTEVCVPQGDELVWTADYCPAGAVCTAGRCGPPDGAAACQRDADCGAELCVVFVSDATLGRFCAPATGTQAGGAACADHGDCRSGLCQKQAHGPMLCYTACADDGDCDAARTCQDTEVTVSGIRATIRGCMVP
jgi:hypothetical protein